MAVVVFGASWAQPGDALYEESMRLGRGLASHGLTLINGGYNGTMEGSARGAAEVAGSERIGVIVSALFPSRAEQGNPWLTRTIDEPDLLARIRSMALRASCFVVMRGTLGTLTEVAAVWNIAALTAAAGGAQLKILCYRDPWETTLKAAGASLGISEAHMGALTFVEDAAEAVAEAAKWHAAARGSGGEDGAAGGSGGGGAAAAPVRE